MVYSPNVNDRQKDSLIEMPSGSGLTARRVTLVGDEFSPIMNWTLLAVGNNILASYPNSTTEVYQYRSGITVVYELTVTYTNSTKEVFLSVERTA